MNYLSKSLFTFLITGSSLFGASYNEFLQNIPSDIETKLKPAFDSLQITDPLSIDFQPLLGGFSSSKLYKFSNERKTFVLRTLSSKNNGANAQREVATHTLASDLGIAPKIYYADPDNRFIIMEFIEGPSLSKLHFKNEKVLLTLGSSIRKIHDSNITHEGSRTHIDIVSRHYMKLLKRKTPLPSCLHRLFEDFMDDNSVKAHKQVVNHGDPHPYNIIMNNGKPIFLDFAGATYDSMYADLGYLSHLSAMTKDEKIIFLTGYFGRPPTADDLAQIHKMEMRFCLQAAIIWFEFSSARLKDDRPLKTQVEDLDKRLQSDEILPASHYLSKGLVVNPVTEDPKVVQNFALSFLKEHFKLQSDKTS